MSTQYDGKLVFVKGLKTHTHPRQSTDPNNSKQKKTPLKLKSCFIKDVFNNYCPLNTKTSYAMIVISKCTTILFKIHLTNGYDGSDIVLIIITIIQPMQYKQQHVRIISRFVHHKNKNKKSSFCTYINLANFD